MKKTKVNWFSHIIFFLHIQILNSHIVHHWHVRLQYYLYDKIQISEVLKYNDSCVATLDSNQIERIIHVHYIFKITTCTCRVKGSFAPSTHSHPSVCTGSVRPSICFAHGSVCPWSCLPSMHIYINYFKELIILYIYI